MLVAGWYAESSNYVGIDAMFHAVAFSSSGNNVGTSPSGAQLLTTTVVNGVTWKYRYQTITIPSDYNGTARWYLGYVVLTISPVIVIMLV